MISNQILLNTIENYKAITRVEYCIVDADARLLVSTYKEADAYVSGAFNTLINFANSEADSQVIQGNHFFKIYDDTHLEYILIIKSANDDAYMVGKMAVLHIQSLIMAYKERYDKDNFIKNLILDNLLRVDIYTRAKKLRIDTEAKRVVFLIETKSDKDAVMETISSIFASRNKDFITSVDDRNIIIVRELKADEANETIEKLAFSVLDTISTEVMSSVRVSYGNPVSDIREVSRSYKEAKLALDVGKIFYAEKMVLGYSNLGIGRLIYQLPVQLCQMFIDEIFKGMSYEDFDDELLGTINMFFENNLNVSETARHLFIHRNTLVYRLDKIQKNTGLDLRSFDDAITFKISLMVMRYMNYMNSKDGDNFRK